MELELNRGLLIFACRGSLEEEEEEEDLCHPLLSLMSDRACLPGSATLVMRTGDWEEEEEEVWTLCMGREGMFSWSERSEEDSGITGTALLRTMGEASSSVTVSESSEEAGSSILVIGRAAVGEAEAVEEAEDDICLFILVIGRAGVGEAMEEESESGEKAPIGEAFFTATGELLMDAHSSVDVE